MTFPSPLIGILGGMGPQAGLDLANKLIALTRSECDQDHLPFVLFSVPETFPDRSAFLLGDADVNPAYAIADQFEKMSALGVTIAVMACNTAHAPPIFNLALELLNAKAVKLRILHLIEETVTHIRKTHPEITRVGILGTQGTYRSRLYDHSLEVVGLEAILPGPVVQKDDIHAALYAPSFGIKTCPGKVSGEASRRIHSAIHHLHELGAEAVILGCTELALAVHDRHIDGIPVVDPARIVAEKLIRETYPGKLALSDNG